MVSIIITTYNMADTLERCIRSVMRQTYAKLYRIQLIVVDDGSTDNTKEVLENVKLYAQDHIEVKFIMCLKRYGHSAARNTGIEESSGEYLYFLDADDYIHPSAIQILMDNLTATKSDISVGNVTRLNDLQVGGLINEQRILTPDEALGIITKYNDTPFMSSMKLPLTATWNKIFKRELFDDIRFPEGKTHDDNFTAHRLISAAKQLVFTPAVTYRYTYKENSISNTGLYSNTDMMEAYEDRIKFFDQEKKADFLVESCAYYLYVVRKTFENTGSADVLEKALAFIEPYKTEVMAHRAGASNYAWVDLKHEENNNLS